MTEKRIGKNLLIFVNKMKRYLDNLSQTHGLTLGKSRVLRYIHEKGDQGYMYQKELEQAFSIRGSSVNGLVDNLVSQGLLNRIDCVEDKRKKRLSLTDKGIVVALESIKQISEFEKELENTLTKDEIKLFYIIFEKLNVFIDKKEQQYV